MFTPGRGWGMEVWCNNSNIKVIKYRLNVGTGRLSIFLKQRNMHFRQITHNQLIIIIFVNIKSQKIIKSNTSIGYYMTSFVVQNEKKNVSLLLSKHQE